MVHNMGALRINLGSVFNRLVVRVIVVTLAFGIFAMHASHWPGLGRTATGSLKLDPSDDAKTWASLVGIVPGLDCKAITPPAPPAKAVSTTVPRLLHFVWIGGRPLPVKYCVNLATFVNCLAGDGYSIALWMDTPPPSCLPPKVVVRNSTALLATNKALNVTMAARTNVGSFRVRVRFSFSFI